MQILTTAFAPDGVIPPEFAFCAPDPQTHVRLSGNRNPDFEWRDVPPAARSLVLLCHDPDVPSKGDDVNKEGRSVAASLSRIDFFHWVLIDLPANSPSIERGEFSDGVTARGKPGPHAPRGARQGINDYTGWFASDEAMSGEYFGYDGPCPPWNDEMTHRYVFTLYAVDVLRLDVQGTFKGTDVQRALRGHVVAQASVSGRYTLNPTVRA
ncbi:MAG: YbhB/YbcL family Raf kinase inhibitor-like protein [Pseudomonadota bacterium]|nr:YbhB/YbcL family Raf kinase inhibitor-like protein [Pseudomonadota bacterium]